jgi:hypothetical protein
MRTRFWMSRRYHHACVQGGRVHFVWRNGLIAVQQSADTCSAGVALWDGDGRRQSVHCVDRHLVLRGYCRFTIYNSTFTICRDSMLGCPQTQHEHWLEYVSSSTIIMIHCRCTSYTGVCRKTRFCMNRADILYHLLDKGDVIAF